MLTQTLIPAQPYSKPETVLLVPIPLFNQSQFLTWITESTRYIR